jgi:hypothetical protein
MTVDLSRIFCDENEGWLSRMLGRCVVGSGREVTQLAHRFVDLVNIGEFPNVVDPLFERFCTQFAARAQLPEAETGHLMKQWLYHKTQGAFPFKRFFPAIDSRFGSCDPLPALEAPVASSGRTRVALLALAALALGATALYLTSSPAAALQICENTAAQCAAPAALSTVGAAAEVWIPAALQVCENTAAQCAAPAAALSFERTIRDCALALLAGIGSLLRRRMRDPAPLVQSSRPNFDLLSCALEESVARTTLVLDEKEEMEQLLQNSKN